MNDELCYRTGGGGGGHITNGNTSYFVTTGVLVIG